MQLFLIRHPQPDVAAGICYGQTDLALPKHQHHQLGIIAQTLQQQLPSEFVVYTSPLQRCRLLAEQLHASPLVDDRLKEMHFGEWEMQAWDALPRDQLDAWAQDPLHYVVPGGESVAQLHARVVDFVAEHQTRNTHSLILVTHAGVMKVLSGQAQRLSHDSWMQLHFDYASLHCIDLP